jgi:hypothetical protein
MLERRGIGRIGPRFGRSIARLTRRARESNRGKKGICCFGSSHLYISWSIRQLIST